jgi:hypothetical protein
VCHPNILTTRLSLLFQSFSSPGCVWFDPWFLHYPPCPNFFFIWPCCQPLALAGALTGLAVRAKSAPHRSGPSWEEGGWDQQILHSLAAGMFCSAYINADRSAPPFLERQFSSSRYFTPPSAFNFGFSLSFSFLVLILSSFLQLLYFAVQPMTINL